MHQRFMRTRETSVLLINIYVHNCVIVKHDFPVKLSKNKLILIQMNSELISSHRALGVKP